MKRFGSLALLLLVCVANVTDTCADAASPPPAAARPPSTLTNLRELYLDCFSGQGVQAAEACVAEKVALALDALSRARAIPLLEGLELQAEARAEGAPPPPLTPEALEEALPRAEGAKQAALEGVIADRLARLGRDYKLGFRLDADEDEGADEGRGHGLRKLRKMLLPFLLGAALKLAAALPLLLATLGGVALNALGASKVALLATGLMALRRVVGAADDHGHDAYQIDKSYGLLGHAAPSMSMEYASPHDLFHAPHTAAFAAHPYAYGRALGGAPPSPAAPASAPAAAPATTAPTATETPSHS